MLFLKRIELAKEETRKFLRQQGQELQTLSDSEEIFQMVDSKLAQMGFEGILPRETIEMILTQVIAESYSISETVIIDPFTTSQFGKYVKKKNYETPDKILRGNLRSLEGVRALEDDIDFLQKNCNGYVPITEDVEILDQSETVLQSIQNARILQEIPVNLEEHLNDIIENGVEMLDDILGDGRFLEIDGNLWDANQMA